ncbi:MAG: DUF2442 domain-containing protein [Planctomycetes bacterium]|nr:DUF2442 domain-containing protein [Planctomycetota bacterium]
MKYSVRGKSTSEVEVTNVDTFGFWLLVHGKEYFLPYEQYPWLRDARVRDILNVALVHEEHLHWPALDVDLSVESLKRPEAFPLTYEGRAMPPPRHRARSARRPS